jgi:aerobic-type carbon monoxide dehydrogenase small subunit (CoxS/CutS family)
MSEEEKKNSKEENQDAGLGPISRREFTIGSMAILGTHPAISPMAKATTQAGSTPQKITKLLVSTSARTIKLTVNKWKYEVQVEPEWVLRDVLRDHFGFLSIKDMCNGFGACGSCTVIMNGRPILSCMTLAIECDGAAVETAEGIADSGHPLIETYTELYAMQCGYCTPGFIVTAKALLDRIPRPSEADIRDALGGNLCKCSSYPAHIRAVLLAAQQLWEKKNKE